MLINETIVFFDTETTGIDAKQNSIIQIAGIVADYMSMKKRSFNIECRPHAGAKVDQKALEVNGRTFEDIISGDRLDNSQAYFEFLKSIGSKLCVYKADKVFIAGYNVQFDVGMVQAMGERSGDNYFYAKYYWPAIDVAQIAVADLLNKRSGFDKFNLSTVARYYGWLDTSGAHDALFDVKMTQFIFEQAAHVENCFYNADGSEVEDENN